MKKTSALLIVLASALLFSCARESIILKDAAYNERFFVIWSHSDIQPRTEGEYEHYEITVQDVSDNFPEIDMALFAGDIVQKSDFKETYLWYLETRGKAPVKEWFDIAGNHEWRAIDLYREYINSELFYSVKRGNLLILMMSNEKPGRKTYISEETFQWWKNKVKNNQDKIIITVTHGALEGSGLTAARLDRLQIIDSERFRDVLKNYRVDIWISGHSHFPGRLPGTFVKNSGLGGTTFIDNGAIRDDFLASIESRFLFFKEGSSEAVMKRRKHAYGRFYGGESIIELSRPFKAPVD